VKATYRCVSNKASSADIDIIAQENTNQLSTITLRAVKIDIRLLLGDGPAHGGVVQGKEEQKEHYSLP